MLGFKKGHLMLANAIRMSLLSLIALAPSHLLAGEGFPAIPAPDVEITETRTASPLVSVNVKDVVGSPKGVEKVSTKVGWVTTITFRKKDGSACPIGDATAGSTAFYLEKGDQGVVHVYPKLTGASTNINVRQYDGSIRAFAVTADAFTVDAWVNVVGACE